ncbi:PD-(D/E)XK nuclease family protein [Candidatus Daviesbacteria bacterium]|nr:PD-(D/E)XK nuclease family protein [Candidatus Daviesbacteria bacterium]
MAYDPYTAIWVSNTSFGDFLKCSRAYFLLHVRKDPVTRHTINIINPGMSLGAAVHDTLDSLVDLNSDERFSVPLTTRFEQAWEKVTGLKGGFKNEKEEKEYKERGLSMIKRVMDNPGPLVNNVQKLNSPDHLPPRYILSEEENILLCGKVDWLEHFPEDDTLHIIDFKTGVHDEKPDSLQLPIYCLLVKNLQSKKVKKISFWYLDRQDKPTEMSLPDLDEAHRDILELAMRVKTLRQSGHYSCLANGCRWCEPLEAVLRGEAKLVGTSGNKDNYVLND